MSTTSAARPGLPWAALVAITFGISACGGGSSGGLPAPVSTGSTNEAPVSVPEGNGNPAQGTLSDGSDPLGSEGNLPQAQEQSQDIGSALPVDATAEDLYDVAADLRRRFINDADRALVGVNDAYVSGTLDQRKFFCFDDDYPVTNFYCGGDDRTFLLTEYGSELVGFRYTADEACTGPLVEQGSADRCFLEFTEINYGPRWNVIYRLVEVDFELFEDVRVSDRTAELGADACEVTYGTGGETFYNDDALCDQILRAVAVEANGS